MSNRPPDYCPYCGTALDPVDPPTVFRCAACDDRVFHNPCPGGGAAVVDRTSGGDNDDSRGGDADDADRILLVEDFRSTDEWKLPEGRIECGESPREGVARELAEETGLVVDPDDLVYFADNAGEPVPEQYMANVDFAVWRSETTGTLDAGSDATDARFFTPAEFESSDRSLRASHRDRFGTDDLAWLLAEARASLDRASGGD
ncbi:NUDIX domain-containing protein [Halobium salinum]|uniref:NUDIX domain-containing protein n=1 Tax=Halobium salinum TaxID=1364940 RepID=A0ABD5P9B1_9EURY|nr:NUDIX hydrolase [Halobium salinum]